MGIGYTIDSPIKVAHLGISSAISLVDDVLCERMREFYSSKYGIAFQAITSKSEDPRAQRITAYLNVVNTIVNDKFNHFKSLIIQKQSELEKFIALLPTTSELRIKLNEAIVNAKTASIHELIDKYLHPGSIDVNIMTKLDKDNFNGDEKLPIEFNDAHAALRGYALSNLTSSIVLSAGMSPRLYSYLEQFEDFFPDKQGNLKKKIILKVSDYRSAIIQGKIFAKKGLWVSEYRVESGLNCGGHAFASQGMLMGPILEEFSNNRHTLHVELFDIYAKALEAKNFIVPVNAPDLKLTAQGGFGTAEEHSYLINKYKLDSIGWGSPFLLVPEAVSIDKETIDLLANAGESDFYLSDISPVGVKFNNVRGNSMDKVKEERTKAGKPGAPCTKKFLLLNTDAEGKLICTGSRKYQKLKIEELEAQGLSEEDYKHEFFRITNKACICNGLGTAALKSHGLDIKKEGEGITVCPGPNLAYFTKESSLQEMVDHIYGRTNLINHPNRPNLFVKELDMYLDYLEQQFNELSIPPNNKILSGWNEYINNLSSAIGYYENMFSTDQSWSDDTKTKTMKMVENSKNHLATLIKCLEGLKSKQAATA
jgi:hypothetical protein